MTEKSIFTQPVANFIFNIHKLIGMNNTKISRIPANLFRTIEFPEFASDIYKVVEKHNRPELKIDEVFSMLKSAMTEVEKITVSERSHPLTAQLQTLRADIDNNLVALTTLIKGVSKIKVENINAAGLKALPVLRRFISGINRKNFFQKRKLLLLLFDEINADPDLVTALETLGLKILIDELKRDVTRIGELQSLRRESKSQAERIRNRLAIANASTAISNLFRSIEIAQKFETTVDYSPLISELNQIMADYRFTISKRSQSEPIEEDIKKTDAPSTTTSASAL